MTLLEALLLGVIQGLTEFLPISSSGHIELGKALLNVELEDDVLFTVIVHFATVLSIIVVFYKDLIEIFLGVLKFTWNIQTRYFLLLLTSLIPVGIVGVFFKDQVDLLFTGNLILVGSMLLVTGAILLVSYLVKDPKKEVTFLHAGLIGVAQAIAVLPGISRSGSTIVMGLLLGIKRKEVTRFAFLMLLMPVIGATILEMKDLSGSTTISAEYLPLAAGFVAAFITGLLGCKWMIQIVRKGKLYYFSIYCFVIGIAAIIASYM